MKARAIRKFTDVGEALSLLLSRAQPISRIEVLRPRDAVGRVSAEDVFSPSDRPSYHASHMDGYAIRSSDTVKASPSNPVRLRIAGWLGPSERRGYVAEGEAYRVHTGAYLPEGADAVVPQEDVAIVDGYIEVTREYKPLEYVDPKGSDVSRGMVVLRRGEVVSPVKAALLETVGVLEVKVLARPRVGIIVFGTELTDDPEKAAREGYVLNTLGPMVSSMVRSIGCEARQLGIVPDEHESVRRALINAVESCDCVLTIGGSSVGDVDVLSKTLSEVSEVYVQGLRLQPGRVGGFAVIGGKPLVILPGLVHSTVNVFNYLAVPLLSAMQGLEHERFVFRWRATLLESVRFDKWIDFLKIVWVRREGAEKCVRPLLGESSRFSNIANADGFIEVGPNVSVVNDGEVVEVLTPSWVRDVDARYLRAVDRTFDEV